MLSNVNATRKELKQYITLYQEILELPIEKLGVEIIIKHNKEDADNMLDDINAKLIEVCEEYLLDHNLSLDKFQLATVVMDLHSRAVSELEAPYKAIIKENKTLIKEYLEKNKDKKETLERIKKENETLDKEIIIKEKEAREKKVQIKEVEKNVNFRPETEMPSGISEAGPMGSKPPSSQPKRQRARGTDALAMDNFTLPI